MNRRAFLTGLIAAPLVVRTAGLLMPVKVIETLMPSQMAYMMAVVLAETINPPIWVMDYEALTRKIIDITGLPQAAMVDLRPGAINYGPASVRPLEIERYATTRLG